MPTPAVRLKFRKIRRRFGITAPRVVVRGHFPWFWFVFPVLILVLLLMAAWLMTERRETGDVGRELALLRQQFQEQREELLLLRTSAGTGQNAVSIERASQQQLLIRIQGLERENQALKEDMLLFERLIPVVGEEAEVRVENFRVISEGGDRYRYRVLLAFQPGRQSPEFRGRLQLIVGFQQAAKDMKLTLPDKRDASNEYLLELKHFLRREGVFQLPAGAQLKGVEVRVLQGDTLKAKRLAQF